MIFPFTGVEIIVLERVHIKLSFQNTWTVIIDLQTQQPMVKHKQNDLQL